MKYCSSCGAPLNDGAKFCPKCGKPVATATNNAAQPQQPSPAYQDFQQQQNRYGQQGQFDQPMMGQNHEQTPKQPGPLESWFMTFLGNVSSKSTLVAAMIVCIAVQVLIILSSGDVLDFHGNLRDISDSLNDIVPVWVFTFVATISVLWVILHVFDCCYKRGIRNALFYITAIVWAIGAVLLLLAYAIDLNDSDISLIKYVVLASDVLMIIVGAKLVNTDFDWLGKVLIGCFAVLIISELAASSLLLTIIAKLCIIGTAIFVYTQCKSSYEISYDDL